MENMNNYCARIITGAYQFAPKEQQEMIQNLFGTDAAYKYEIYFHWYNVIHELGHAIMNFNCAQRPHPAEEEQLVNNFANAYWKHYGELEKLEEVAEIVKDTLSKFVVPDQKNVGYMEYAKENWGTDGFFTFNNYGWFQYNSVLTAMEEAQNLEHVLHEMCGNKLCTQKTEMLKYTVSDDMPMLIVTDAVKNLRKWGVCLPEKVEVVFCDDVNQHRCQIEDLTTGRIC